VQLSLSLNLSQTLGGQMHVSADACHLVLHLAAELRLADPISGGNEASTMACLLGHPDQIPDRGQ